MIYTISHEIWKWFFFCDNIYTALPVIIRADNEWAKARVLRKIANETSIQQQLIPADNKTVRLGERVCQRETRCDN